MLNRRYLRIKVYQALYAYWQGDPATTSRLEKELYQGIDRVHDLYLSLMLVLGELRHVAELRMEERRKKRLPTPEDLNPNRRFVENALITGVAESEALRAECEKRRISWVGHHELFMALFKAIEESEAYKAYMAEPATSFTKDRAFVVELFSEQVANSESLQDVYEARSIYWLEDLDLAAGLVKRVLEQWRQDGGGPQALSAITQDPAEERGFVNDLFRASIAFSDEHEALIAAKASNWEADRIAYTDMILMKMALAEVRTFDQIPVKVTLNEYIEIAKAYSTPKSKNFINGVLDKLFVELRADGRIRKVGRGLLES
ncbi:MAG: transcription antitermination protein NusB [Flavobacteriales bacterium]|jgi:N utilization substance protein B|nr:MAG: transcription antitermination protein NusB [Flavobacteriales bacterium]